MRLRAGRELAVVDVSVDGALVEGEARLLPGTHVDVHIATFDGRVLMRSRVVRAYVAALWSDRVQYRGGLAFDRPLDLDGYCVPSNASAPPSGTGSSYPPKAA